MTRPLPDIDLARIAWREDSQKRAALELFKFGRPPLTYQPTRKCYADILNVQPAMFGEVEPTALSVIEERIKKASRSDEEELSNLRVARGLHALVAAHGIKGRRLELFPLQMRMGWKVSLWLPTMLAIDGRPYGVFVDPRRTKGLDENSRRFAFSLMHERIRAEDPDFADVGLAIVRFHDPSKMDDSDRDMGIRSARLYTDEEVTLYSLDEMEAMVDSTYKIWREVSEGREEEARRKAGGAGPLFGD